jgi:hypothetical protein
MKKSAAVLMAVVCILSLAACSSSDNMELSAGDASGNPLQRNINSTIETEAYVAFEVNDMAGGAANPLADVHVPENETAAALPAAEAHRRRIIRDASMVIESRNPVELFRSLSEYNRSLGGYEFSNSTQNFDSYSVVTAILKVPPERLDMFMNFAGDSGIIITSSTTSSDITAEFYDLQTRIETKRRSLESYYTLLERANSTTEILTLQRTIDSIIEEIEAFEGRVRVLASLSDMATVRLEIRQEVDPEPEPEPEERREIDWNALTIGDMGYFIRNGFIAIVNFFMSILQWVVIALAVTSPIWFIPAVIVVVIIIRRKNKNRP